MKEFFKKRFLNRSIGLYLGFASAVLLLISDFVYVGVSLGDKTFSIMTFVLILVGIIIEVAYFLLDVKILDLLPVLSCICYSVAVANFLSIGLETLSDVWNGVNFVGGNPQIAIAFIVLFFVGLIAEITSAFMKN